VTTKGGLTGVIDAWMQHPTRSFRDGPMFESLRCSSRAASPPVDELPIKATIKAMDEARMAIAMCSAWWGVRLGRSPYQVASQALAGASASAQEA
jgi:hypothetical protein